MQPEKTLIFSILYNRLEMFRFSSLNVLTHAKNAKYVLWNNGTDHRVAEYCLKLAKENPNPSVEVHYIQSSENVGLNAAREIVNDYLGDCSYIMSVDEDILYLPFEFQSNLQTILKQEDLPVGYVACNVFQDCLTNGAMPPLSNYTEKTVGNHSILLGPTGGWASMTSRDVYEKVGGFVQKSEQFFGLDGLFSHACHTHGFYTGVAKDVICYHATGAAWNLNFGYQKILDDKMQLFAKSNRNSDESR